MTNKIISKGILTLLVAIVLLLLAYVLSSDFRCLLEGLNIDPNYLIVFLTSIAVLLSLVQASKDRKIAYNSNLIQSLEDKGLRIIGKLLTINNKAKAFNGSLIYLGGAIKNRMEFKDLNNLLDKSDIENDLELIGAYIEIYYPELGEAWNSLWDDFNKIANNFSTTYINYQANIEGLLRGEKLIVKELDNIPEKLKESQALEAKIHEVTEDLRNQVLNKMSTSKKSLKNML